MIESVLKTNQNLTEESFLTVGRVAATLNTQTAKRFCLELTGSHASGRRTGIFFLSASKKPDLIIKTAYELTRQGVMALDFSEQFLALDGLSETEILKRVRDLLTKKPDTRTVKSLALKESLSYLHC